MSSMMSDLAFAIPGVDEAMGFAEIMKHVKSMEYSVIVFDTAPTGHTLRFLSFPTVLEKALAKFSTLGRSFGPMLNQVRESDRQLHGFLTLLSANNPLYLLLPADDKHDGWRTT